MNYSEQKANNSFLTISNKTKSKKAIHLSINQLNVQKHMLWILMFNQNMLFKTFIQRRILIFVFKINLKNYSNLNAFCKFCTMKLRNKNWCALMSWYSMLYLTFSWICYIVITSELALRNDWYFDEWIICTMYELKCP